MQHQQQTKCTYTTAESIFRSFWSRQCSVKYWYKIKSKECLKLVARTKLVVFRSQINTKAQQHQKAQIANMMSLKKQ